MDGNMVAQNSIFRSDRMAKYGFLLDFASMQPSKSCFLLKRGANSNKITVNLKKDDVQSHQSTENKEQGTKISHSCICDKAIVLYELLKRPAQGALKQEIHIFVEDFATPRNGKVADSRRKKANRASKGAVATNKVPNTAPIPSF